VAVYEGTTAAEVELYQRLMFAAAAPLIVGFVRFSFCFGEWHPASTGQPRAGGGRRVLRPRHALGARRRHATTEREVPWLGQRYLEIGLDPLGLVLFFSYGAGFCYLIWLYGQHLGRLEEHAIPIFSTLCVWAMLATNDMADPPRVPGSTCSASATPRSRWRSPPS
jgi:hypothetical protein